MSKDLFEDFAAGLNHAEIGGMIAEKWNFPDNLVHAIRYHHEPDDAPGESRDVVETVYLANALINLETKNIAFDQIDKKILSSFGMNSENQVQLLLKTLQTAFIDTRVD